MTNMKQDQNKPREECMCHCHLGGNVKDCKSHEVLSCNHCTDMNRTKEIEEKSRL